MATRRNENAWDVYQEYYQLTIDMGIVDPENPCECTLATNAYFEVGDRKTTMEYQDYWDAMEADEVMAEFAMWAITLNQVVETLVPADVVALADAVAPWPKWSAILLSMYKKENINSAVYNKLKASADQYDDREFLLLYERAAEQDSRRVSKSRGGVI